LLGIVHFFQSLKKRTKKSLSLQLLVSKAGIPRPTEATGYAFFIFSVVGAYRYLIK